jgi:glutaconate CoA-transferase subunit A
MGTTILNNRVTTLEDAAKLVKTGDIIGLGGMTMYRRPVAFVRELLRRDDRPTDLTLLCFTAGYESDLLIGAGMVSHTRSCYFGLEAFGLAPMFTQAANLGEIRVIEETESSLAMGIRAKMAGVGFMPAFAWMGTDLLKLRPDIKTVQDPYSDETLVAFPALECDVAVIHALVADKRGNARLNKNWGVDRELGLIAKTVIITAEEIVDKLEDDVDISAIVTSAVVHAPQGAFPTSCYPLYPIHGGEILRYIDACNGEDFEGYLERMLADDWMSVGLRSQNA